MLACMCLVVELGLRVMMHRLLSHHAAVPNSHQRDILKKHGLQLPVPAIALDSLPLIPYLRLMTGSTTPPCSLTVIATLARWLPVLPLPYPLPISRPVVVPEWWILRCGNANGGMRHAQLVSRPEDESAIRQNQSTEEFRAEDQEVFRSSRKLSHSCPTSSSSL
jgi:hypothetical protein